VVGGDRSNLYQRIFGQIWKNCHPTDSDISLTGHHRPLLTTTDRNDLSLLMTSTATNYSLVVVDSFRLWIIKMHGGPTVHSGHNAYPNPSHIPNPLPTGTGLYDRWWLVVTSVKPLWYGVVSAGAQSCALLFDPVSYYSKPVPNK